MFYFDAKLNCLVAFIGQLLQKIFWKESLKINIKKQKHYVIVTVSVRMFEFTFIKNIK